MVVYTSDSMKTTVDSTLNGCMFSDSIKTSLDSNQNGCMCLRFHGNKRRFHFEWLYVPPIPWKQASIPLIMVVYTSDSMKTSVDSTYNGCIYFRFHENNRRFHFEWLYVLRFHKNKPRFQSEWLYVPPIPWKQASIPLWMVVCASDSMKISVNSTLNGCMCLRFHENNCRFHL